jgi:hypothetical protein
VHPDDIPCLAAAIPASAAGLWVPAHEKEAVPLTVLAAVMVIQQDISKKQCAAILRHAVLIFPGPQPMAKSLLRSMIPPGVDISRRGYKIYCLVFFNFKFK